MIHFRVRSVNAKVELTLPLPEQVSVVNVRCVTLVLDKARLAHQSGYGGVFLWEIGQDKLSDSSASLAVNLHAESKRASNTRRVPNEPEL